MKKIIIITFFLIVSNVYADEVRMATSEDIDLFDQAVEASTKIEKNNFKSDLLNAKDSKAKSKSLTDKGQKPGFKDKDGPTEEGSSVDDRVNHREERSGNKRRNKKRKRDNP